MGKIDKAAAEAGEAVEVFVPRVIEEEGTIHKAAARIGVYPNTINFWLRRNGLRVITRQVARVEKADV